MEDKNKMKVLYLEDIFSNHIPLKYYVKSKRNVQFKYVIYYQLLCQSYDKIGEDFFPGEIRDIFIRHSNKYGFYGKDSGLYNVTSDEYLKNGSSYVYSDYKGQLNNYLDMWLVNRIFNNNARKNDLRKIMASRSILAASSYLEEQSDEFIIKQDNLAAIRRFLTLMEDKDLRSFLNMNFKDVFYNFDITDLKEQITDEIIKLNRTRK